MIGNAQNLTCSCLLRSFASTIVPVFYVLINMLTRAHFFGLTAPIVAATFNRVLSTNILQQLIIDIHISEDMHDVLAALLLTLPSFGPYLSASP